jgi:hypothetical protein
MLVKLNRGSISFFPGLALRPIVVLNIHLKGIPNDGPFDYTKSHIGVYFKNRDQFVTIDIPFSFLYKNGSKLTSVLLIPLFRICESFFQTVF